MGYDRLECLYIHNQAWFTALYLSISALSCHVYSMTFGVFSLLGSELWLYAPSNSLLA